MNEMNSYITGFIFGCIGGVISFILWYGLKPVFNYILEKVMNKFF